MAYHRDYSRAAYGADYMHNLRWRYRAGYGIGTYPEPYRGGGSYGRGYEWGEDHPPDVRDGERTDLRRERTGPVHWPGPRERTRRRDRYSGSKGRRGGGYRAGGYTPRHPVDEYAAGPRGRGRGRRPRRVYLEDYGPPGYEGPYAPAGPYRRRLRRSWRPGTASRDYDRAYPYFSSSAALEATSGYPPGDSLNPDAHPRGWTPDMTFYGDVY